MRHICATSAPTLRQLFYKNPAIPLDITTLA
nr:MAG TPA: hypothetical protein [Caudoviricetes sp.]